MGEEIRKTISEEIAEDVNVRLEDFKTEQIHFIDSFKDKSEQYAELIRLLQEGKTSLERNKVKLSIEIEGLQKDVQRRIEACKDLNPLEIASIKAYDKDNPISQVFIWIFGLVYRLPTKNLDLKKETSRLKAEDGKQFQLKLAGLKASDLRAQEKEATELLLEKQTMYLQEKESVDMINNLKGDILKDREELERLQANEQFQSLDLQKMLEQQDTYSMVFTAMTTIKRKVQKHKRGIIRK